MLVFSTLSGLGDSDHVLAVFNQWNCRKCKLYLLRRAVALYLRVLLLELFLYLQLL
jgi:hypothetical protein